MATNLTTDNIYEVADSGFVARTGVGTAAGRTITGTSNEIAVANGNGVSGNPTLSLPSTIVLTGKTITGLAAASVVNTPAGNIAATTVQAAINELDTEKQPLDADLTAIAALTTTSYGRAFLTQADEAAFKDTVNFTVIPIASSSGATKTIASTDKGKILLLSHTSDITTTLPNNLTVGFQVTLVQAGAGPIVLDPASGATIVNVSGHVESAAQWGVLALVVIENSGGSAAKYLLSGNTAA